jgi:signal transduction histidine kinase
LVERDGQKFLIPWTVRGPNSGEIRDLLISEGWLGFFFWAAGTFASLTLRPKDERWRLFIAFNYLTAAFLALGSGVSFYHIWESAVLLRIVVWFCIPVYLHLHWVFPQPLAYLPKAIIWMSYVGAGLLAIAQWFEVLPPNLYFLGYLLAVFGSIVLLLLHAIKQPETRRELGVLVIVAILAFLPSIVTSFVSGFMAENFGLWHPWISGGALLSLPLFPAAYVYAVYRRRLANMELRASHLLSSFVFLSLVGMVALTSMILLAEQFSLAGSSIISGGLGFLVAAILVVLGFAPFQAFFEHRILGISLPPKRLLEIFSAHIVTSVSQADLIRVLQEEVLPSLLIRQFAFLYHDQGSLKILSTMGLHGEALPGEKDVQYLRDQSGVYRSPQLATDDLPSPWVRLILPLQLGDQLIGFWLLGRRDPDDFYSQQEILTLTSLANLTAIALSNILQTERLTTMYQANIDRYEQERLRLAHDLHDSILNELAALLMRADAPDLSPKFQQAFDGLTERLREIVNDLRPPMIAFGLKLALEDLAETFRERAVDSVTILTDIEASGEHRYASIVENNLYRIVQQACENSLRYAQAKKISLFGRLHANEILLRVEDDGLGLGSDVSLNLNDLIASRHFGLAGMHERASLIGAELNIVSKPGAGTQIQLVWKLKESI